MKQIQRTGLIGAFALLAGMLVPASSYSQHQRVLIYSNQPPIKTLFTEPFELMAIYTENGKTITVTSHLENKVYSSIRQIKHYLNLTGSDLASVRMIVHNHLYPQGWSHQDRRFFCELKEEGFRGEYLIYYSFSDDTLSMEEPSKIDR